MQKYQTGASYIAISTTVFQDTRLSLQAKGLFAYLWTIKEPEKLSYAFIASSNQIGVTALKNALQELIKYNYLSDVSEFDEHGKTKKVDFVLSDQATMKVNDLPKSVSVNKKTQAKDTLMPIYKQIIDYLNQQTNSEFKVTSKANQALIHARLSENNTLEDFKLVIDFKTYQWLNDPKMQIYLRPKTLFGSKFDEYLVAAKKAVKHVSAQTNLPF